MFAPLVSSLPLPAQQLLHKPSPLVPALLGTWQAGPVWLVNRDTHELRADRSPVNPDLSDNNLMPYGQRLEFTDGYDADSRVTYWQVIWLTPYPPNACRFPFLQFHCSEINGVNQPRQKPTNLEFTMVINHEDIDLFFPVGATKTGRVYLLRCGGNDEWTPKLYVSKDRQRLWISYGTDDHEHYQGLQEYHRVAEYKPRSGGAR